MNCPRCGRALESGFRYCPECGRAADGIASFSEVLDHSFSRISSAEAAVSVEKLSKLSEDLLLLEHELEELAASGQRPRDRRR